MATFELFLSLVSLHTVLLGWHTVNKWLFCCCAIQTNGSNSFWVQWCCCCVWKDHHYKINNWFLIIYLAHLKGVMNTWNAWTFQICFALFTLTPSPSYLFLSVGVKSAYSPATSTVYSQPPPPQRQVTALKPLAPACSVSTSYNIYPVSTSVQQPPTPISSYTLESSFGSTVSATTYSGECLQGHVCYFFLGFLPCIIQFWNLVKKNCHGKYIFLVFD